MKIANTKRCVPHVLAALLLTAGGATEAFAQTTVNVTGKITGECRITGGQSLNVQLGDVPASTFTGQNSDNGAARGMQNITLSCTSSPGIKMTMSGTRNEDIPTNTTLLALTNAGGAGVAKGVAVQLLYSASTGTPTATPTTVLVRDSAVTIPTGNTVTVRVGARYVQSTVAAVTAGAANTTATLTFTIN